MAAQHDGAASEPARLPVAAEILMAQRAAAAAEAVAGVVRLDGTRGGAATYLPGGRIAGVRVGHGWAEVHLVAEWPAPIPELAEEVRAAVAKATDGLAVGVFVEDLDLPVPDPG